MTPVTSIVRLHSGQVTHRVLQDRHQVTTGPLRLTLACTRGTLTPPRPLSSAPHSPEYITHYKLLTAPSHARVLQRLDHFFFLPLSHSPPELSPVPGPSGQTGSRNALGDIERPSLPTTSTQSTCTQTQTHPHTHPTSVSMDLGYPSGCPHTNK